MKLGFRAVNIALLVALLAGPVAAQEQVSGHRDNSGRQIAVVVPGMPHPVTPPPVPVGLGRGYVTNSKQPAGATSHSKHGARAKQREDSPAQRLSNIATPVELSPEVKQAIQKGVIVAQGLSNVAVKRAGDAVVWVSTMWRQLNDVPQITPTTEYRPPMPPVSSMRPMDADRSNRLYFTNEYRLKTVVAR